MDASEIKRRVSIAQVLAHYGAPVDEKGKFHCPGHDDTHASGAVKGQYARCWSQGCLGPKGVDIFGLVGFLENLTDFREQKQKVLELFWPQGLKGNGAASNILRVFEWTDAKGRTAYHLRLDDPGQKFKWNQQSDGSGPWTLKPCQPDVVPAGQGHCRAIGHCVWRGAGW